LERGLGRNLFSKRVSPDYFFDSELVSGSRIAVEFIIELLAEGWSEKQILKNYNGLTEEDIHACLAYTNPLLMK